VRLKLRPVSLDHAISDLAPGEIRGDRDAVRVGTGSHAVRLGEVQPQGRTAMPASDWARGVRLEPGERLGR
jgi:methionyl-tRNA formyltransferase